MVILLIFAGVAILEGWPLVRRGLWRESAIFAALWLAGLILSLFLAMDRPLNPVLWLDQLFKPLLPLA